MAKYFLYADESGDSGHDTSVTTHFVLVGFILAEAMWLSFLHRIKEFRKKLRETYGVRLRDELRARDILKTAGDFERLGLCYARRCRLLREIAVFVRESPEILIIPVSVDRSQRRLLTVDIREYAWKLLIQRFENFLVEHGADGLIFSDQGEEKMIRDQLRKMRVYNPIPSKFGGFYTQSVAHVLEDPVFRESKHSYFIQLADVVAYLCRLRDNATARQRKWGLHRAYKILKPRYLPEASRKDPYAFVYG
jgi:hypothetical protein